MAKRKRLEPPRGQGIGDATANAGATPRPEGKGPDVLAATSHPAPSGLARATPPIAQIAGEAASRAALEKLSDEMRIARESGRMVQALPLDVIERTHLIRDRIISDPEEMEALKQSLRRRGQQTPIEVVDLGQGRYGLISGWRRLEALTQLRSEVAGTEEAGHFDTVLALLRRPDTAGDAYCAMVEENEIRVGLSYYERARIAARATDLRIFGHENAVSILFASASRSKRSKINSFVRLYQALDDQLRFPTAIPERLGLALVRHLEFEQGAREALYAALKAADPQSAEEELSALQAALTGPENAKSPPARAASDLTLPKVSLPAGLTLKAREGRLVLSGQGVDADLAADLAHWLAAREGEG